MTTDQTTPTSSPDDDTQAHHFSTVADAEQTEGEGDTHAHHFSTVADAEQTEGDDDTQAHGRFWADAEQAEGDGDAEGEIRTRADADQTEGDDTEGHGVKFGFLDDEGSDGEAGSGGWAALGSSAPKTS